MARSSARLAAMALTSLVLLTSDATRAQDVPHARLRYDRGSDACPDEAGLRDAVSARLGYVPFADDAPIVIEATIRRAGRGFRGELRVLAADGTLRGERSVASADGDCDELGRALALAISVAIDPLSLTRGAADPVPEPVLEPTPVEVPECAPCAEAPVCPPPAEVSVPSIAPAEPRRALVVSLGVGVHAAIEAAPAQTIGASLDVALRVGEHVSVGLEARADLPQSRAAPSGRGSVSASFFGGTLAPCAHLAFAALCGTLSLGALRGEGSGVDAPLTDVTFFAMAGGRLALTAEISELIALRVHGGVEATLTPTTLELNDRAVFEAPPVSGTVGARLVIVPP